MDALQQDIARVLTAKALRKSRATYQQVAEAVGWGHDKGRGLGKHLDIILHELHERGLPPLTTILVPKGKRYPPVDAMASIRAVIGDMDIDAAQATVFGFDWLSIPDLAPQDLLPANAPSAWLTSFWGFDPGQWGCIGFADESRRRRFLKGSKSGGLVAIYVTKGRGPEAMRGNVVGILEVSHTTGHASDFISPDRWTAKESDRESRGKWTYAVQATRAWRVVPEDYQKVDDLLPLAYASADPQKIGSDGVPIPADEAERLLELDVYEVEVFGQRRIIDPSIKTLETAVGMVPAGPIATQPYWVGETDGPRHLYILKLDGDVAAWLGRPQAEVNDLWIIKVGLSKSPFARRDQIQDAWPQGSFLWSVFRPEEPSADPPYANGSIAAVGEKAMKSRLVEEGAEWLGGEFYLAPEWLVRKIWTAGWYAAEPVQEAFDAARSREGF